MHELGIATSIIDAVKAEAARRPGTRPLRVGLRVGELAGVSPDSLAFCFESLVHGTELESVVLAVETPAGDELELSYLELEESAPT